MKPHRKISSSPAPDHGPSRGLRGGLSVAALVLLPLLAVAGGNAFRAALDYTAGVLSLVSLTAAVVWGLIATDRLLLSSRQRLLSQGVHRATAVASLGFLLLHITIKIVLGHAAPVGLVPFGLGLSGTNGLIGLGALAGLLMIVAAVTGAMRSAFAAPGRIAGRWRALHMPAYPAWCFALMHGLYAGRPAAAWVVAMYCLSLAGVAAALSLRLLPRPLRNRVARRLMALTGAVRTPPESEPVRRDPAEQPLPGAVGLAPQPGYAGGYERTFGRQEALSAQPLGRPLGGPPGQAPARRYESARYEAVPPVPGRGITAGYRAVSTGGTGEIPVVERVLMTDELPLVPQESGPGYGLRIRGQAGSPAGAVPALAEPGLRASRPVRRPAGTRPVRPARPPPVRHGRNPRVRRGSRFLPRPRPPLRPPLPLRPRRALPL